MSHSQVKPESMNKNEDIKLSVQAKSGITIRYG